MRRRAVFLDRDGTINLDRHYLYKVEEFSYLPGAVEGLRRLAEAGFCLIVVTNQSGIARGYFTEEEYLELDRWMRRDLAKQGVPIAGSYYCPHLPEASVPRYRKQCTCRKPGSALFRQAAQEHDISLDDSFAIGDRLRDLVPCFFSGCRGFLIGENETHGEIEKVRQGAYPGIRYLPDLCACAACIVSG